MNGYAFTRFEADFTSALKAKKYDISIVAAKAKESLGPEYYKDVDYADAKFWFIETTMSCDLEEAVNWMKYYMANAIAYGIQTKNLDWMTKFLAAYDILKSFKNVNM